MPNRPVARGAGHLAATVEPVAKGLVLQCGAHLPEDERALALARRIVSRQLSGRWSVEPLGPHARDFHVRPLSRALAVGRAWDAARRLQRDRDTADAEPDLLVPGIEPAVEARRALLTPRERAARKSSGQGRLRPCARACDWSLALCDVPAAWRLRPSAGGARYGSGITIGHPDTGYTRHPEIWSERADDNRVLVDAGRDFVDEDADAEDPLERGNPGHGTATASVIMSARETRDGPFVHGTAPEATLVPLRVTPRVVLLSFSSLTRAIYFAADQGHHVVSMSLGGVVGSAALERAIAYAVERGVILLAAAGNVWPWVVYPARYPTVIAVGACNCRREPWQGSAAGAAVDVSAPGESVWRAGPVVRGEPPWAVSPGTGTSYAVATLAGICALWLARHGRERLVARYGHPRHLAPVFRELLVRSGVDVPSRWNTAAHGGGIVNARKLLVAGLPASPPATGMKAVRTPAGDTALEALLSYVPGVDPEAARSRIQAWLGVDARALGPALAEHGRELQYHVATNPALRAALSGGARQGGKAAAARVGADPRFLREASASLKRTVLAGI